MDKYSSQHDVFYIRRDSRGTYNLFLQQTWEDWVPRLFHNAPPKRQHKREVKYSLGRFCHVPNTQMDLDLEVSVALLDIPIRAAAIVERLDAAWKDEGGSALRKIFRVTEPSTMQKVSNTTITWCMPMHAHAFPKSVIPPLFALAVLQHCQN